MSLLSDIENVSWLLTLNAEKEKGCDCRCSHAGEPVNPADVLLHLSLRSWGDGAARQRAPGEEKAYNPSESACACNELVACWFSCHWWHAPLMRTARFPSRTQKTKEHEKILPKINFPGPFVETIFIQGSLIKKRLQ